MQMVGPPGTGKTTAAEAVGDAFALMGITSSSNVVKRHPSQLVEQLSPSIRV
jgi:MoxR-like ATPase